MEEAFSFANDYDSWSQYGFHCHYYNLGWPGTPPDSPQDGKDICFKEDLQSLLVVLPEL